MSKKSNGDQYCHHHDDGVGHRAWKLLRLALLWARKGGVLKRYLMMELRIVPKFLKNLATHKRIAATHQHLYDNHSIQYYFERQLSFDKTPIFPTLKIKMHRPSSSCSSSMRFINIPCLNQPLVLDFDEHHEVDMIINDHEDHTSSPTAVGYEPSYYDDYYDINVGRQSFLTSDDQYDDEGMTSEDHYDNRRDSTSTVHEEKVSAASSYNNTNYEDESVDIKADEFIAEFYKQIKLQRQIPYNILH